jgi:hypothetical protein
MNNYRVQNYGGSYYDQGRLGYSSVSKNYGMSNRSIKYINIDLIGQ